MELDVLIFGGGAAGLWLLDELSRRGDKVLLLEAGKLGQGQTVASQGIIHGGLKYTLHGLLTPAAREIRDMPDIWRKCLSGRRAPDLRQTRLRSQTCYLWRSQSLRSRLGMLGAKVGLHVAPTELAGADRPSFFAGCPGTVAQLDEQVISPASFIANLACRHHDKILKIRAKGGVACDVSSSGNVQRVVLSHPKSGQTLELSPGGIVLAAGGGNAALRRLCRLPGAVMQKRPLHMVLVRGPLPNLNGHCVDGARTRVTITSDQNSQGETVWQVGGQIAEDGVALDAESLVRHAREELTAVLPALDFLDCEWATYRVDRAERTTPRGGRPDTATVLAEGNVITVWPTKLALVPQAVRMAAELLPRSVSVAGAGKSTGMAELDDWPRPDVAPPPWEQVDTWHRLDAELRPSRAA
jgi:glycerol-3-phosphate dehydrogenase